MNRALTRIALLQMTLAFYCILFVGVMLKIRFGDMGAPADLFGTKVRDYGCLMLPVSAIWCIYAVINQSRPTSDYRTGISAAVSGVILAIVFGLIGCLGTISAVVMHSALTVPAPSHSSPSPELPTEQ